MRRLKTLAHNFQSMSQADEDTSHTEYTPLALQLADEFFLNHQSRDVGLDFLQLRSIAIPRLPSSIPPTIKIMPRLREQKNISS